MNFYEGGRFSISRDVCVASTHFKVMYVDNMLRIYCHEQEEVRGRVSGSQILGSLSDRPQSLTPAGMSGLSHETFACILTNSDVMSCLDICLTLVTSARCLLVTSVGRSEKNAWFFFQGEQFVI